MIGLPNGWVRASLNALVQPKSERVSPAKKPQARYVGLEHVEAHTNKLLGTAPASTVSSSSAVFAAGDVLYGRMRPYLNKVVRPTFDGLASAEFIVFPETPALDSHFLLRRISSNDFMQFACSQYEGDRPRVKFDQLGRFSVDLPPRAEQTRIVAKLEELLSDLDTGVAELKAAQKKLQQYRQSLLRAAVEGALTASWREAQRKLDAPTETGDQLLQRILTERRARWEARQLTKFAQQGKAPPKDWQKKYPEPMHPDTSNLPGLPEGWVWASLDMLGEIASGVAKGSKRDGNVPVREVPYLRVANVQRGYLDLSEVKTILAIERDIEELTLKNGDVLFNEGGDRDKLGRGWVWRDEVAECIHQNHVFRMRPYLPDLQPELISHHGNTFGRLWFQNAGKQTTNLASINMTILRTFPVPVAPGVEQQEVMVQMLAQLENVDRQQQVTELAMKQSIAQRQNILHAAFTGQLVPQDPNDEPASVLLQRIRAERAERAKQPKVRKTKQQKEIATVVSQLIDALAEAGDWIPAQEAFRRCGVADGALTDQIEALYAELRVLDKAGRLAVEPVADAQGRKLYDKLKLLVG
jgi:type I restriction enzyme S subunit